MAHDYYTLGATPAEEDCEQLGTERYNPHNAAIECQVYLKQIQRVTKTELRLSVKGFPHDAGTYQEVVIWYNTDDESQVEEMLRVESELPGEWDEEAKEELGCRLS